MANDVSKRGILVGGIGGAAALLVVLAVLAVLLSFGVIPLDRFQANEITLEIPIEPGGSGTVQLPPSSDSIGLRFEPGVDFEVTSPHRPLGAGEYAIDSCASGCTLRFTRSEKATAAATLQIVYAGGDSEYVDDIVIG